MNLFIYFYLGITTIIKYFFLGLYTVVTIIPKYFIIGIKWILGKKDKEEKKKISFITLILTLIVYLICVFLISRWIVQKLKLNYLVKSIVENTEIVEKEEEKIIEETPVVEENTNNNYYPNDYWKYTNINYLEVNFTELLEKNSDTVAWVKVDNTNVNYPVVQSTDNEFYLYHDYNKSNNRNGWVYSDYRNNLKDLKANSIIYAHNLTNRSMFGSLVWTLKADWYKNENNYNIKLSTPSANSVWRVFSVYTVEVETYYLRTKFSGNEDFQQFINTMKSRSIYDFKTNVTTDDKLLTLSTCDDSGTKRLVVQAKMIKIEYK